MSVTAQKHPRLCVVGGNPSKQMPTERMDGDEEEGVFTLGIKKQGG